MRTSTAIRALPSETAEPKPKARKRPRTTMTLTRVVWSPRDQARLETALHYGARLEAEYSADGLLPVITIKLVEG